MDATTPDAVAIADVGRPDADASSSLDAGAPAGCLERPGLPEGPQTIVSDERMRSFVVRLPNGYTHERRWPVVFALHGNGGNLNYWDTTSGGRNIRAVLEDDAILIIPEAIDNAWRNYDLPADAWPPLMEEELRFFDALISLTQRSLCIDDDAIFAMGFSGGGSFAGVLGCRRTDIRAIAVGGSVVYFDEANCVGRPAAWITIGVGELIAARERYRDYFRDRSDCTAQTSTVAPLPCVAYDGCSEDTPVHYCEHPGGHVWPDFASAAMGAFFKQQLSR